MLLNHYNVHSLRVFERQEAKATRSASVVVPHNCAFNNLSELGEVVPKGFYRVSVTDL